MDSKTETNLFTQEQRDYVADVADHDLRDELLHQLRLRDLIKEDRDSWQRRCVALDARIAELTKEQEEK